MKTRETRRKTTEEPVLRKARADQLERASGFDVTSENGMRAQRAAQFLAGIRGSEAMSTQRKRIEIINNSNYVAAQRSRFASITTAPGLDKGITGRPALLQMQPESNVPLQFKKGEPSDPHEVDEGKYHDLEGEALADSIVVPKVSGCAAVKVDVFSTAGSDKQCVKTFVLHSDGLTKSAQRAEEIGNIIRDMKCPEKSVSIMMILNKSQFNSTAEHNEVLAPLTNILRSTPAIPFEKKEVPLTYNVPERMDIDVTGSEDDILKRYEALIPQEDQKEERMALFEEYKKLTTDKEKRIRFGKLNLSDRRKELDRLKNLTLKNNTQKDSSSKVDSKASESIWKKITVALETLIKK